MLVLFASVVLLPYSIAKIASAPACKSSDAGSLVQLARPHNKLKIWFGYVKEELSCFRPGDLEKVIGGGGSERLLAEADMVVFLQLAHRPSAEYMSRDGDVVSLGIKSCESLNGTGLESLMGARLGNSMKLVQAHQYAEDDPEEPDQSLLSVWYNSDQVEPLQALALKNTFGGNSSACLRVKTSGTLQTFYDAYVKDCATASKEGWPQYASSKSSLVISWKPKRGREFAIFGTNAPSAYYKGKNHMLARTMEQIESTLGVQAGRVFIVGDMNTRLLEEAWGECQDTACAMPRATTKQLELSEQPEEILPNTDHDMDPCSVTNASADGFVSAADCETSLQTLQSCRLSCISAMVCDGISDDVGRRWQQLDPKRGAGGFDLLAEYFRYPADREVSFDLEALEPTEGAWRHLTYKRLADSDVEACQDAGPFYGFCEASPCAMAAKLDGVRCQEQSEKCFEPARKSKADLLPPTDVLRPAQPGPFAKPQIGWLDSFGFSRGISEAVSVLLYESRQLTFGDHAPLVSAVEFRPH